MHDVNGNFTLALPKKRKINGNKPNNCFYQGSSSYLTSLWTINMKLHDSLGPASNFQKIFCAHIGNYTLVLWGKIVSLLLIMGYPGRCKIWLIHIWWKILGFAIYDFNSNYKFYIIYKRFNIQARIHGDGAPVPPPGVLREGPGGALFG